MTRMLRGFKGLVPAMVFIVAILIALLSPALPVKAADVLNYTLLGTHPQAAAQSTERGRTIHKLVFFNNKLYSGYGDYGENTGPIHINPFNLGTNTFTGSELIVPTEEIHEIRVINGKLYAQTNDPSCSANCNAGYATGEPWVNKTSAVQAAHVFDMATLTGSDLWMTGSTESPGTARLWRSLDNGQTWVLQQSDASTVSTNYERYYWAAAINGKLYVQASETTPATPMRIFDGSSWSTLAIDPISPADHRVVTFNNRIITDANSLSAFDGTNLSQITSFGNHTVLDKYVDGSYLYVLRQDGVIVRTSDLQNWDSLGSTVTGASSIAVNQNKIYVGTTDSKLYASAQSVPAPLPSVSVATLTNNSQVNGVVTLKANVGTGDMAILRFNLGYKTIFSSTDGTASFNWDTTDVRYGHYKLSIEAEDIFGNKVSSSPVTITVTKTSQLAAITYRVNLEKTTNGQSH